MDGSCFCSLTVDNRRIPITANLIRELKATADPEFKVQSQEQYKSGVTTSQVSLFNSKS